MARLNIIISDNLDQEMRNFIEENNMTITVFLHLAISRYIETQKQSKQLKELLMEEFKKMR